MRKTTKAIVTLFVQYVCSRDRLFVVVFFCVCLIGAIAAAAAALKTMRFCLFYGSETVLWIVYRIPEKKLYIYIFATRSCVFWQRILEVRVCT